MQSGMNAGSVEEAVDWRARAEQAERERLRLMEDMAAVEKRNDELSRLRSVAMEDNQRLHTLYESRVRKHAELKGASIKEKAELQRRLDKEKTRRRRYAAALEEKIEALQSIAVSLVPSVVARWSLISVCAAAIAFAHGTLRYRRRLPCGIECIRLAFRVVPSISRDEYRNATDSVRNRYLGCRVRTSVPRLYRYRTLSVSLEKYSVSSGVRIPFANSLNPYR
jgi:hypothetical protein